MSSFSQLPFDIFRNIMAVALRPTDAFTQHYRLGWICQSWRAMALPQIYSKAYIKENGYIQTNGANAVSGMVNASCAPDMFNSNLPLIVSVYKQGFVKDLVIHLTSKNAHINLVPFMYVVLPGYSTDASHSPVHYVKQHIDNIDTLETDSAYTFSQKRIAYMLANLVKQSLPNVSRLSVRTPLSYGPGSFFSLLVNGLSGSLEHVKINSPLVQHMVLPFTCISSLTIHLTEEDCVNLVINTRSLKALHLFNISHHLPWNALIPISSNVVLENLETLELSFRDIYTRAPIASERNSIFRIVFPKLRYLHIRNLNQHNKFLETCSFPLRIKSLRLISAPAAFTQLRQIARVDNLYAMFNYCFIKPDDYHNINHWVGRGATCSHARIEIQELYNAGYGSEYWPGVTHFTITSFILSKDSLQLILNMPKLKVLTLKQVEFDDYFDEDGESTDEEFLESTPFEPKSNYPLNSSIELLEIFDCEYGIGSNTKREIEDIIAQMPGLKYVVVNIYNDDEFAVFKYMLLQKYSHILNVYSVYDQIRKYY